MNEETRSSFDVIAELLQKDIDTVLFERFLAKTPTERIAWLEEIQSFAELAKEARKNETSKSSQNAEGK